MADANHGPTQTLQTRPIPAIDQLTPAAAPAVRPREQKILTKRNPAEVIARAKDQLHTLIGYTIEGVAGFNKADEGWNLSITAVELHRIPMSTDVLALYLVKLDEAGDIISYHRGKRYSRRRGGGRGMNPGSATAVLTCPTGLYNRTESKIAGFTESINRSVTPAEKIRNARELRDCVAVLLDCIDFDEGNPNCRLCRETVTLRDGIASVIEKAGALAR